MLFVAPPPKPKARTKPKHPPYDCDLAAAGQMLGEEAGPLSDAAVHAGVHIELHRQANRHESMQIMHQGGSKCGIVVSCIDCNYDNFWGKKTGESLGQGLAGSCTL